MSTYATAQAVLPRARSKKRRIALDHALRALKIIGNIPAPLPPELPPSPPASRSASPVPPSLPTASSSKRKLDALADPPESVKRPRVAKPHPSPSGLAPGMAASASSSASASLLASSSSSTARPLEPAAAHSSAAVPLAAAGDATSRSLTVYEPVRRPRHGIESLDFRQMHRAFYNQARAFKYSGEARYLSTYPQSHSAYRALRDPPAKGSPYHTHGGLMALLESLEALISFVYAGWCQDRITGVAHNDSWETIPGYLNWCKAKWSSYVGSRDSIRERSFIGLIHMIETFTHQRIVRFKLSPHLERKTKEYLHDIEVTAKAMQVVGAAHALTKPKPTPPEKSLPSPDTDAASANSTPANPSISTPSNSDNRLEDAKRAGERVPSSGASSPEALVSVKESYIKSAKYLLSAQATASHEMRISEKTLSLAIMREHFPHTFGRMVCSTLSADEEYEPDMEDGEGELFWPSQCVTGEGIAWVCLMGRAMVREFGKDIGYAGFSGIVPKPGGTS